ncbi:MAG: hypothetical protein IPJ98_11090 [Bryobacterales bacterium]|nr:hypothetical protein [Bryobacterales bacterium]
MSARAEQRRLAEGEERFRQIAETIQDGFWVMDARSTGWPTPALRLNVHLGCFAGG